MRRHALLGGASLGTLMLVAVAAALDEPVDDAVVVTVARPQVAASAAPTPAGVATARGAWPEPEATALAAWSAPSPPPPPAAPPRASEAAAPAPPPAFPYQWLGSLVEAGVTTVMLGNDQRSLAVRAGDTVDANWRIERVAERRIDLVWVPTGQSVPLAFR